MIRILTAAALLFTTNAALSQTFDCRFPANKDWIPPRIVIQYNKSSGTVRVRDAMTQRAYGGAIEGQVDIDNSKRVTFKWQIREFKNGRQFTPSFSYRATIQKGSKSAQVTAKPLGYTNVFKGRGRC